MANINYQNFTLGIEEEYMVIDPASRELKSHEQKIVLEGQKIIRDMIKAEMHQAVVEVGTDICTDINEAYQDVSTLRKLYRRLQLTRSLGRRFRHASIQSLGKPAHYRPCQI